MNSNHAIGIEKLINYSDINYPSTKLHIKIRKVCENSEYCFFDLSSKVQKIKELHRLELNHHPKRVFDAVDQKNKLSTRPYDFNHHSNFNNLQIQIKSNLQENNTTKSKTSRQLSYSDTSMLEDEYVVDPTDAFTYSGSPNKCNGSIKTKDCVICELKSK